MTLDLLAPPPPRVIPPARKSADRAQLRRLPVTEPAAGWRRRRRWMGGLSAVALVLAGGGVATAVIVLDAKPATVYDGARCYAEESDNFTPVFPGADVSVLPDSDREVTDARAREACAQLWRAGYLPDPKVEAAAETSRPVPPLTTCVLPDGVVGVFPADAGVCARLNLPPLLEA